MKGVTMQYFFRYGEVYPIFNQSKWIMTKEQFMIEEISKEIVLLLMEEHQMDMREALKALYTSDTYSRLINLDTGSICSEYSLCV